MKPDIGAAAEHMFAAELLLRGHMPSWPSSQMHPYDLICDTGKNVYRVQVKGSDIHRDKVQFAFRKIDGQGKRRRYSRKDTDFIVLYLIHYDTWYIFPVDEVRVSVRINPGNPKCKFKRYANAWHFFV